MGNFSPGSLIIIKNQDKKIIPVQKELNLTYGLAMNIAVRRHLNIGSHKNDFYTILIPAYYIFSNCCSCNCFSPNTLCE